MAHSAETLKQVVNQVCEACGNDRTRMMDIVIALRERLGAVNSEAMDLIAKQIDTHRVEVESIVSFYAFFSQKPKGKIIIRLCNDIVAQMTGLDEVARVFVEE